MPDAGRRNKGARKRSPAERRRARERYQDWMREDGGLSFREWLKTLKWKAGHLVGELQRYRSLVEEWKGRMWDEKRLWKDPRLDEAIRKLMSIADDPDVLDTCGSIT